MKAKHAVHSVTEVIDALRREDCLVKGLTPMILDGVYRSRRYSDWMKSLRSSRTKTFAYRRHTFDCDNFAIDFCSEMNRRFDVNGVGIVIDFSNSHAYNVILARGRGGLRVVPVEPQNGRVISRFDEVPSNGIIIFP